MNVCQNQTFSPFLAELNHYSLGLQISLCCAESPFTYLRPAKPPAAVIRDFPWGSPPFRPFASDGGNLQSSDISSDTPQIPSGSSACIKFCSSFILILLYHAFVHLSSGFAKFFEKFCDLCTMYMLKRFRIGDVHKGESLRVNPLRRIPCECSSCMLLQFQYLHNRYNCVFPVLFSV